MDALPAFILAALALVGSPGPATLSIAAAGAAYGPRRGVSYMVGVVAGLVVVMALTASGLTAMLWALPGAASAISVLAAAYFIWLAWKIATAPPLTGEGGRLRAPGFASGVILSLVNPKAYASMAALFSGFTLLTISPIADALAKIAVLVVFVLTIDIAWLFAGAALTRHFRDPKRNRAINIGFAVLLVLAVAATLVF